MATKKSKKKVIDGVTKSKKAEKTTSKAKKAAPFASEDDAPFAVSVEDTAVAITIDDPDNQGTPIESPIEDKPSDKNETTSDKEKTSSNEEDVADAIKKDSNTDAISEPAIEEPEVKETEATEEEPTVEEPTVEEPAVEEPTIEEDLTDGPTDSAATADNEGLVASAILEDDVIDKNLDSLINDIEGQDAADETTKAEQKDDTDKALAAIARQDKKQEEAQDKKDKQAKNAKPKKTKKQKSTNSKPKASAKPFRIFSRVLALIATGAVTALGVRVATTGIVPNKYLIPGFIAAGLLMIFILFKTFRNKTRVPVLIIMNILSIIITAASIFGFAKIDETMAFLNRNFGDDTEYSIYDVVVKKESNYNNLNDVRGKTFHSISDFVDTKNLEEAAKEQANATIAYESGITTLLDKTLDSATYISVINSGTYEAVVDNDEEHKYANGLKIIGELKVKVEKKDKSTSSLTEQSSVIYLSGIDTRSGQMLDRSLSDVNIVITMNPKTKEILMTTIPRDYYVQLHGTSGLPDKLTHAGSLGGVQLSMDTIGDLLDVDFSRYIRVNFNFVVDLVDAIGGITVYSDVDHDITAWTDSSCVFHPGNNDVDGKCALAFARERYAYSDGDRHRGRNQEQVIEKIFEKITSSTTLISRYSSILDSLNGSFDTDVTPSDITSLANMQLDDMAKWTINTYNLDGDSGLAYTYSYPSQKLSVMFPNVETVDTAKQKIHQVLNGTTND